MNQKQTPRLSKTRFIAGLQCPKRLYLSVYPPEGKRDKSFFETMPIYNGYAIGDLACQLYPGVMVAFDPGLEKACETTKALLAEPAVHRIHEATFRYRGIVVRSDLLERSGDGWMMTEVKGSTSVKDYYLNDATVQTWVLQGCGIQIKSAHIMHVNNKFVYQGDDCYDGLLMSVDVSEQVAERIGGIDAKQAALMQMLQGDMPDIAMGEHCHKPFTCEFCDFCQPEHEVAKPIHIEPRKPSDQKAALNTLNDLPFPRYYIDFETVGLAIPRWKGVRPFMQVPFQWSCHIQYEDGSIQHASFLDMSGNDPRRACAEKLIECLHDDGVLIAYNAPFEQRIIRHLAYCFSDLKADLMRLHDVFFDLLPLTRKAYYHPSQQGSWSLKAVLPALVPELSYDDLDGVKDGNQAQLAWFKSLQEDEDTRQQSAEHLLEYCKLDTWAMVKMVEALKRTLSEN